MKRRGYLSIILVFLAIGVFAQAPNNPEVRKQIEAAHVAALTKQLNLSPEEAERFWPIYNNYQREFEVIQSARRQAKIQNASKADGIDELEFDTRVLELRKKYQKEFRKALPEKRAMAVFRADREFNNLLIRQLRDRRKQ